MVVGDRHPKTMKKTIKVIVLIAMTVILSLSISKVSANRVKIVEVEKVDPLSYQQRAWLWSLVWCESKGNPEAINPKDLDNTPSYGLIQFKPGTFSYYTERYGIDGSKGYMDPEAQIKIVEQMILRNDVKWSQQFPSCVKKLGNPPRTM